MPSTRTPRNRLRSLETALAYQNEDVIDSFLARFGLTRREARDLFLETKRWIWLSARARQLGRAVSIRAGMILLDEMWHTFVLFSKEYAQFCSEHVGAWVPHGPTTRREVAEARRAYRADPVAAEKRESDELLREMEVVYDLLGEKIVERWYGRYMRRYTPAFLDAHHRSYRAQTESLLPRPARTRSRARKRARSRRRG